MTLSWNGRPICLRRAVHGTGPTYASMPVSASGPVATEYPHPPNYEGLFVYQRQGVDWLRSRRRGLLSDEMGLGKTAQALRSLGRRPRCIVVCPAFLRSVWRDQAALWRPDLRVAMCAPGDFELPGPATGDVVVCSYEGLPDRPRGARTLFPSANLSDLTLFVDEAHYCKTREAQRTIKVAALARQCARAFALTGTPLLGHPFDLWGVLSTFGLASDSFGTFDRFVSLFSGQKMRYGGWRFSDPDPEVPDLLRRVSLRRTRSEVMPDLPRKIYDTIYVDAPVEVTAMLDGIATQWSAADGELPPFELLSAVRVELARYRIPALLEHVARFEQEQTPLVVFSSHRDPILALSGRPGWGVITGDTPSQLRESLVSLYQEGMLAGLAGTIQAMGVGLTLTRGSHALFVDLSYTPAENHQAEDRLVRIGQTAQSVQIARMVSRHPVDVRLLEILDRKATLIARAVG